MLVDSISTCSLIDKLTSLLEFISYTMISMFFSKNRSLYIQIQFLCFCCPGFWTSATSSWTGYSSITRFQTVTGYRSLLYDASVPDWSCICCFPTDETKLDIIKLVNILISFLLLMMLCFIQMWLRPCW